MSHNLFQNVLEQLRAVQELIKVDDRIFSQLQAPQRFLEVAIPVRMDDGSIKIFIGYRSQFNDARGPFKGGVRFHPQVTAEEIKALSAWMTWKTAVVGIPLGGGKGGVIVDPALLSERELEALARGYIRSIKNFVGAAVDIPAPDVNTDARVMGWMLDEFEKISGSHEPGMITGKPLSIGGSKVREYATAQGAFFVLRESFKKLGLDKKASIAIQGFGNAGAMMAKVLSEQGYKVVAASDSKGTVINGDGLPVEELIAHKKETGCVAKCENTSDLGKFHILEQDVDVLIPAALENSITEENADMVKAKLVIEVANGPVTPEADKILAKKGVMVVPDILANAGGVAVSYFEQAQNAAMYYWEEREVSEKLEKMMKQSFDESWKMKEKYGTDLRMGAYALAVGRVSEAMKNRGRM